MKRGKILKVRPFNMANFSGGSAYLPLDLFFDLVLLIPYYMLMALIVMGRNKKGEDSDEAYDNYKLNARLNKIVLPIISVMAILWIAASFYFIKMDYNDFKSGLLLILICGVAPGVITYFSLKMVVTKYDNITNDTFLYKGLRYVFLFSLVFLAFGIFGIMIALG